MEQFLAILLVLAVAAAFYGVNFLKKKKMYPACDKFAQLYCELADNLLDDLHGMANLNVETLAGGLFQIRPMNQQPEAIRSAFAKTIDEDVLAKLRELFFLRDEIQAEASNGSFAKDKYNAITNQLFDSINTYLSIIKDPTQNLSSKDLEQFHFFMQKQVHIRNITFPAVVSRSCAAGIAV